MKIPKYLEMLKLRVEFTDKGWILWIAASKDYRYGHYYLLTLDGHCDLVIEKQGGDNNEVRLW